MAEENKETIYSISLIFVFAISIVVPAILFNKYQAFSINTLYDYYRGLSAPLWVIFFTYFKIYYKKKTDQYEIKRRALERFKETASMDHIDEARKLRDLENELSELGYYKASAITIDNILTYIGFIGGIIGIILYIIVKVSQIY